MVKATAVFMLGVVLCVLGGCSREGEGKKDKILMVSILPQRYFAAYIAGGEVEILTLVGPGQDPHTYEPTPRQMAEAARAGAWVLSGTEFEEALRPKIAAQFPGLTIIDGTEGVVFRALPEEEDGVDRHTWLGLEPAALMARRLRDALAGLVPERAGVYAERCAELTAAMSREFAALREELAPLEGTAALVYHPAFGYFLDEFGIAQEAVEAEGKEPTPRRLAALSGWVRETGAAFLFTPASSPRETARSVAAALGAEVVILDPLAEDWLGNIRVMGEAFKKALPRESGGL